MTRENYGVDAPTVVRNLALGGFGSLALMIASRHFPQGLLRDLTSTFGGVAIAMLATASWMVLSSVVLKKVVRDHLLDSRAWQGDEQALDVGCGRGLVAIGMARRLGPAGRVHGLDLWQSADLSNNSPDRTLANGRAAGVIDRLTIDTGDMRALPYADASFDVVASMTAIHNIPTPEGRKQAIREIWRVTRSGGELLIFDIRHARAYAAQLRALGAEVKVRGPIILWGLIGWRFSAKKPIHEGGAPEA